MDSRAPLVAINGLLEEKPAGDRLSLPLRYAERVRGSWIHDEHVADRNFHGSWEKGTFFFLQNIPLTFITGGRGLIDDLDVEAGYTHMKKLSELPPSEREKEQFEFDGKLGERDRIMGGKEEYADIQFR